MPRRSPLPLPIVAVTLAVLAMGLAATGRGAPAPSPRQDPAVNADPAPPASPQRYFEATTCGQCHTAPGQQRIKDFVRLNEYPHWQNLDKHSSAFASLQNERSQRMGTLLGWDVATDVRCLSCHAPAHADSRFAEAPAGNAAAQPDPKLKATLIGEGVSCAACHGPNEKWVSAHSINEKDEVWIAKTAAEKRDKYGMTDLRDPQVRSTLCASCHVGDDSKNRVVTHDMYAAGHPPLPGLETATFSQAEPPHWWSLSEVGYLKRAPAEVQKNYGLDQAGTQQAKLVAVGGLVSFREAMRLFVETAAPGKNPFDFARFDCSSCHHELKVSDQSWRQSRGFSAAPGRPPAADWPSALASLAIVAGDPVQVAPHTAELTKLLETYRASVGKTPFGNTEASVAAARALMGWADARILDLQSTRLDRDAALRMLKQITRIETPDHASARQLAWGFRNIYNELDPKPANGSQIQSTLNELTRLLDIDLTPGKAPGAVIREVGARLEGDERFEPATVGRLFETLGALLP